MSHSQFDDLLLRRWRELHERGDVFVTGITEREVKILPGSLGLVGIYEPMRVEKKRPGVDCFSKISVYEDFDDSRFNFTKVKPAEILFRLKLDDEPSIVPVDSVSNLSPVTMHRPDTSAQLEDSDDEDEDSDSCSHVVMINASPIFEGHFLLCLYLEECLPQILSPDVLFLALQMLQMSARTDLKLSFNSLAAFASVNHLHFQGMYTADMLPNGLFPVEKCSARYLVHCAGGNVGEDGQAPMIRISELENWPVRGFLIDVEESDELNTDVIQGLSDVAGTMICQFLEYNIPHNLLISSLGRRIYVFPRQPQSVCKDGGLIAAYAEASGVFPSLTEQDLHTRTEESLMVDMERYISLNEEEFSSIKERFLQSCQSLEDS